MPSQEAQSPAADRWRAARGATRGDVADSVGLLVRVSSPLRLASTHCEQTIPISTSWAPGGGRGGVQWSRHSPRHARGCIGRPLQPRPAPALVGPQVPRPACPARRAPAGRPVFVVLAVVGALAFGLSRVEPVVASLRSTRALVVGRCALAAASLLSLQASCRLWRKLPGASHSPVRSGAVP